MLDKEKIKENFSKSAAHYEQYARLQKELADTLFQSAIRYNPKDILDVGSGTGYLADKLAEHFPAARVTGIDIAPGMVKTARERYSRNNLCFVEGDMHYNLFPAETFDLVVSNVSFQWMAFGLVAVIVAEILKPGGHFIFTTFGTKTLQELRKLELRTNRMISIDQIKTILDGDFVDKEFASMQCIQEFGSLRELGRHLKAIGARMVDNRVRKELKISALKKLKGRIAVTFEVIYVFARKA